MVAEKGFVELPLRKPAEEQDGADGIDVGSDDLGDVVRAESGGEAAEVGVIGPLGLGEHVVGFAQDPVLFFLSSAHSLLLWISIRRWMVVAGRWGKEEVRESRGKRREERQARKVEGEREGEEESPRHWRAWRGSSHRERERGKERFSEATWLTEGHKKHTAIWVAARRNLIRVGLLLIFQFF